MPPSTPSLPILLVIAPDILALLRIKVVFPALFLPLCFLANTACLVFTTRGSISITITKRIPMGNDSRLSELNTSCVVNTHGGDSYLQVDDTTHGDSLQANQGPSVATTELNTSCVVNTHGGDSYLQVDDITHGS